MAIIKLEKIHMQPLLNCHWPFFVHVIVKLGQWQFNNGCLCIFSSFIIVIANSMHNSVTTCPQLDMSPPQMGWFPMSQLDIYQSLFLPVCLIDHSNNYFQATIWYLTMQLVLLILLCLATPLFYSPRLFLFRYIMHNRSGYVNNKNIETKLLTLFHELTVTSSL